MSETLESIQPVQEEEGGQERKEEMKIPKKIYFAHILSTWGDNM